MSATPEIATEIAQYEEFIKVDPENALLWLTLGDLYHRGGRTEEAIASYEKYAQFSSNIAISRSRIASVLITQHRFAEAEKIFRSLLEEEPEDPGLLHNLGLCQFYQHRWQDAEANFRAAQEAGIDAPSNLDYLARSLHQQSRMDEAMDVCRQWMESSGDPAARGYLALLAMDGGDMATAVDLARETLATSPENSDAAVVVGTSAIEHQDIDEATELFDRVTREDSGNPRGWLGLGLVHFYHRDFSRAIEELQRASELMPNNSGTIVALGWAHLARNDIQAAEQAFRKAIEVDRNFAEAHGGLAVALAYQGKVDQANEASKHGMRLNPRNFGAAYAKSVVLKIGGRDKRATDIVAGLLQQEPIPGAKPLIEHIQDFVRKNPSK